MRRRKSVQFSEDSEPDITKDKQSARNVNEDSLAEETQDTMDKSRDSSEETSHDSDEVFSTAQKNRQLKISDILSPSSQTSAIDLNSQE